jgi:hypothetical protein
MFEGLTDDEIIAWFKRTGDKVQAYAYLRELMAGDRYYKHHRPNVIKFLINSRLVPDKVFKVKDLQMLNWWFEREQGDRMDEGKPRDETGRYNR